MLVLIITVFAKLNTDTYVDTPVLTNGNNSQYIMFQKINEERAKNKLKTLKLNSTLCQLASLKAKDIADTHFPSHYSVKYGSPADMLINSKVMFKEIGENISCNVDVINSHNALMDSAGHRENILNDEFEEIGIGVSPDEDYGNIFVQLYIGR